ncbi:MAG: hypothetical protein WCS01_11700 [bacterium]
MSATREFVAVRARVPNAYNPCAVYLIDAEDLKEWKDIAGYFPAGTRDVQEVGRIQVMGDTHLLGTMYEESL